MTIKTKLSKNNKPRKAMKGKRLEKATFNSIQIGRKETNSFKLPKEYNQNKIKKEELKETQSLKIHIIWRISLALTNNS